MEKSQPVEHPENRKTLELASHPENLSRIRATLRKVLELSPFSSDTQGRVVLAVDEACSNIIRHGYQGDFTGKMRVSFQLTEESLQIIIEDSGIAFDVNQVQKRDVSQVKPGGLGLYIIQEIMDQLDYSRSADGINRLCMTKRF